MDELGEFRDLADSFQERSREVGDGMTSRERVVATLNHEEPDRVPIDFGSNFNTGPGSTP